MCTASDREHCLNQAKSELRSLQTQALANAQKLAECQASANAVECEMDELSARSSNGQGNSSTIGEMMRALKDARAAQMQLETVLITDLMAARERVSELNAIVAATQADADAEEAIAVAQWEEETAAAVRRNSVEEAAAGENSTETQPVRPSVLTESQKEIQREIERAAAEHIVVIDYSGSTGIIQVGLVTDTKPRLLYAADDCIVSAAFELNALSSMQKEACCGYELCECLPSQQRTFFRRPEALGSALTIEQKAEAMSSLLDGALAGVGGKGKIDQVEMSEADHKSVSELCYRIARLYSPGASAVKSAHQLEIYSGLFEGLGQKYGFRVAPNEQLGHFLERVVFHLVWYGVDVTAAEGFDALLTHDFCSAYLELCTRMFADLNIEPAKCKVLFTTVMDRPDLCECATPSSDTSSLDDGWVTIKGGKTSTGLTASQMCVPVDSLPASEIHWKAELMKLNQPEPGLIHFSDRAARCMSELLVEGLGVKAVQCIPPVQAPWEEGWSSAEASWVGAAAVARSLPEHTVANEVQVGNRSKLVLNGQQIPWIFSDDGEQEGLKQSDRRQAKDGVWSHLVYAKFGSILVTVFQPQGRLTDVFEET